MLSFGLVNDLRAAACGHDTMVRMVGSATRVIIADIASQGDSPGASPGHSATWCISHFLWKTLGPLGVFRPPRGIRLCPGAGMVP